MTKPKTYHVYHERTGFYYQLSECVIGPSGMAYAIVMVSLDGTRPPLLAQHSPPRDAGAGATHGHTTDPDATTSHHDATTDKPSPTANCRATDQYA